MSAKKKKGKSETRPELTEEISESTFERVPVPLLEDFFALSRPGLTGVPRQRKDKAAEAHWFESQKNRRFELVFN